LGGYKAKTRVEKELDEEDEINNLKKSGRRKRKNYPVVIEH
jgi:hypothetical protein